MSSKNVSSADNQQERIENCGWIVGIVDGEGSFLVNIFRSPNTKFGWQIFPEFNVSQSKKGIDILYALESFFECGHIYEHKMRNKNKRDWDSLFKYCVRSRKELQERIIPFFQKYPPHSKVKRNDYKIFVRVVKMMSEGKHYNIEGMRQIAEMTKYMTHRKSFSESSISKFLSSSETIRRA